jgi:hypothetical protein
MGRIMISDAFVTLNKDSVLELTPSEYAEIAALSQENADHQRVIS